MTYVAQAQTSMQKYFLESVGFEYVSSGSTTARCVQWRDLVDKTPAIEYDDQGRPFLMLELEARVEGNCSLKLAGGKALDFSSSGTGAIKVFRFRVDPPSSVFVVYGPGFQDQLIFEALVSKPVEIGFLKFFEGSKTKFHLGYGTFSTTNSEAANADLKKTSVFPIMSGAIVVPSPWTQNLQAGLYLSQNLTNLVAEEALQFQIAEFALDLRYQFSKPVFKTSIVAEMRGRSWFQLTDDKVFVVRSSPGPGVGLDFDGWLGAKSSWGYSALSRYGFRSSSTGVSLAEFRAGATVLHKISNKWAAGLGYKWSKLNVDFTNSDQSELGKISEQSHVFEISLQLIPGQGKNQ